MKETYPTSTTWPYTLSVLVLLALVLAPPTKWVSTIHDVRKDLATWFSPEGPPAHTLAVADRVVVSFDPSTLEVNSSTAEEATERWIDEPEDTSARTLMLWEDIPHEFSTQQADTTNTAVSIPAPGDTSKVTTSAGATRPSESVVLTQENALANARTHNHDHFMEKFADGATVTPNKASVNDAQASVPAIIEPTEPIAPTEAVATTTRAEPTKLTELSPRSADVYVWQPPPGWKPELIQPWEAPEGEALAGKEPAGEAPAATTSLIASQPDVRRSSPSFSSSAFSNADLAITPRAISTPSSDEPVFAVKTLPNGKPRRLEGPQRVAIQPPVARRIARLPRIDPESFQDRIFELKPPNARTPLESHSATIDQPSLATEAPSNSSEDIEPQEPEMPAEPEPSDSPNRVAESEIAELESTPNRESGRTDLENQTPKTGRLIAKREAEVADIWPQSSVFNELLLEAKRDVVLTNWATAIEETLSILQGNRVTGAADQRKALARLRELAAMQGDRSRWPQKHRELHDRTRLTLLRRVDVWQPLMQVAYTEPSAFATYRAQKQLHQTTLALRQDLAEDTNAAPWIEYLALETLMDLRADKVGYRKLADEILLRMYSSKLSDPQRQFLQSTTFAQFETDLRNVIAKSVHPADIMQAIEAYESTPSHRTANDLILLMQRWRSAPESKRYRPALDMISAYYRNANFRVSISEDLINRFVPAIRQYAERVEDTILGASVTGRSSTYSNLAVKLIPDDKNIRLGLLAEGTVESNTASRKGPVTTFSRGQSAFAAGKEVRLSPYGMTTSPTETRALSGNEVLGIRTDWDDVPFVGSILRSMAKDEIDEQKRNVEAHMENRVRQKAQQRMDRELDSRVVRAEQNLARKVVEPLRRLRLDPRAMEMRTTHDRAIMRTRLAGPWQFAAHTPRPQVRVDSVMSFQIHQSAANNVIEQLQLQNRRMTIEELMATLSQRFGMPLQVVDESHKDIVVKFGEHPLEFDFNDGQIQVTIHFAEMKRKNRRWKNFSIRGIYRADVEKLDIALEREESVSLIGERIGLRDQLALRGIASKVFGKHQRLEILREAIQQQPQLRNLTVTQFTIRDGWLAIALGESTGESRMAERSVGLSTSIR